MGINNYKETNKALLIHDIHPIAAGITAALSVGLRFALPSHVRIWESSFKGNEKFLAIKSFWSLVLDGGVVGGTVFLLSGGNIGEAALLKLGYNSACSVVPDALRSIRSRLEPSRSHVNPAQ